MASTPTDGYVLAPGEGLDSARGGRMALKARGAQTADAFALLDLVQPREIPGPPLHVHHECDEAYYVLDGALTVRLGARTIDAAAGSFVLIPRGVVHTFTNRGSQPARFLATLSPASYVGYVEEINALHAATPAGGGSTSSEVGRSRRGTRRSSSARRSIARGGRQLGTAADERGGGMAEIGDIGAAHEPSSARVGKDAAFIRGLGDG